MTTKLAKEIIAKLAKFVKTNESGLIQSGKVVWYKPGN